MKLHAAIASVCDGFVSLFSVKEFGEDEKIDYIS